jgi:hypothetical protein
MADADDERFRAEIERLHMRLEWISEEEARSAMVGGVAAQGQFHPERDRIIKRTDEVLDDRAALINARSVGQCHRNIR